jgi:hypothetical protein
LAPSLFPQEFVKAFLPREKTMITTESGPIIYEENGIEMVDRAEIVIQRAVNCGWITVQNREQLKATIRIALDTEVRAGGPYPDKS